MTSISSAAFLRPPISSLPTPSSPLSAYIHLPFCAQQCAYCAFPVIVSGRSALPKHSIHPPPLPAHQVYIDLLCNEIRAVAQRFRFCPDVPSPIPLRTLYLGGGTPSLLHPNLLERVLQTVQEYIGIQNDAEITCEMDPVTFTDYSASRFRELGVNRASVGAQSFNDDLLTACRRVHRKKDIWAAMEILRDTGFSNISMDLISGLPGQTMAHWMTSLEEVVKLQPEHVSAYDLTLEKGTVFGEKYQEGTFPLPEEYVAADMMKKTAQVLGDNNFEHYEISNFAKRQHEAKYQGISQFRSRHNMCYWNNQPFYAFGLGATSLIDGFRFARPRRHTDYRAYVEQITSFTYQNEQSCQEITKENVHTKFYPGMKRQTDIEILEDHLINSFRLLVEGVNLRQVEELFGNTVRERITKAVERNHKYIDEGNLNATWNEKRRLESISLTEKGALMENTILSTLMGQAVWQFNDI